MSRKWSFAILILLLISTALILYVSDEEEGSYIALPEFTEKDGREVIEKTLLDLRGKADQYFESGRMVDSFVINAYVSIEADRYDLNVGATVPMMEFWDHMFQEEDSSLMKYMKDRDVSFDNKSDLFDHMERLVESGGELGVVEYKGRTYEGLFLDLINRKELSKEIKMRLLDFMEGSMKSMYGSPSDQ